MKRTSSLVIVIFLTAGVLLTSICPSRSEGEITGKYVLDLDKLYIVLDADHGHIEEFRFKPWDGAFDITPIDGLDELRPFSAVAWGYDENHILGGLASATSSIVSETPETTVIECRNNEAMIVYSFYKTRQFFDVWAVGYRTWAYVMRYSFVPEHFATNVAQGSWVETQIIVTKPWVAVNHEDLTIATCWNQITQNADHVTLDNSETVPLPPGATAKGVDIGDLWMVGSRIPSEVSMWFRIGAYFSGDPWYKPAEDQSEQFELVEFFPNVLNMKSRGKWITSFIQLPGTNASDIEVSTILLNDTIPVDVDAPTEVGDRNKDGILDLMVKFDRQEVIALLCAGETTLTITGEINGSLFEASDTVRVIN